MLLSGCLLLLRKDYDVGKRDLEANNVTVGVSHGVCLNIRWHCSHDRQAESGDGEGDGRGRSDH
jgi:hypothetical protein